MEIKEGIASNSKKTDKQSIETKMIRKEVSDAKASLKQCHSRFKDLEMLLGKKTTEIDKLEDDLKHAKTEINSLKALESQFVVLKCGHDDITEENAEMKKEMLDCQRALESEQQQQKRCLRCKRAARRKFKEHRSH